MKEKRIWILSGIGCIIAILGLWYLYTQFTMSFGVLGVSYIIVILSFGFFYHYKLLKHGKKGHFQLEGYISSLCGAVLLVMLGALSIFTLNKYFNADKHVYRNIDHHAMRIDGIGIRDPHGFMLAGNNLRSFFDDKSIGGQITIQNVNPQTVELHMMNFRKALYQNHYAKDGKCYRRTLLNAESLPRFTEEQRLQLQMKDGQIYEFYIDVIQEDSVNYHLVIPDSCDLISDEHRFLTKGLPLAILTRGTNVVEADFSGIHIIRDTIDTQVKMRDRLSTYRHVNYCIEVQNQNLEGNYVVQVRSTDEENWHHLHDHATNTIQIPINQVFQIGYDEKSTRPTYFTQRHKWLGSNQLALLYKLPLYHYLVQTPEKGYSSVSVRTSLTTDDQKLEDLPENILLFDEFYNAHNVNNMPPIDVAFVAGETARPLHFQYTVQGKLQQAAFAGDKFTGTNALHNENVEWMVSVEDFKKTSPFQADDLNQYVFIFACLLALLLLVGSAHDMKKLSYRNMFTYIEFVAYAITLYLVSLRWFLLWRTSVFLPVNDVSYYEFHGLFRNTDNGTWLQYAMIGMIIILAIVKLLIHYSHIIKKVFVTPFVSTLSHLKGLAHHDDSHPKTSRISRILFWLLAAIVTVFIFIFAWLYKTSPSICISLPVAIYLINSVIIDKCLSPQPVILSKDQNYGSDTKPVSWSSEPMKLFINHLLNALLTCAFMLFIDSGYGILFTTFTLFWILWKLHEHVSFFLNKPSRISRIVILILIFIFVGLLFPLYKPIIHFIDYSPVKYIWYAMFTLGCIITLGIIWILKWNAKSWVKSLVTIIAAFLFVGAGLWFQSYLSGSGKHTAQRIAVHYATPDEAMPYIKTDDAERRYLQAALNHMIIGEYSNRGDQVQLLGEDGHGYFKMQPHSKVGAMWNAQLTDISVVRFVIAEHSKELPLILVFLFLLMVLFAALQPLYHRWARSLLIQIPLLLFIHSLLIWMATTQRFIFLGQDFPMISINSRLTLIYYFGLILIWVSVAAYDHGTFYRIYMKKDEIKRNNKEIGHSNKDSKTDSDCWRFSFAIKDGQRVAVALLICMIGAYCANRGKEIHALKLTESMRQFSELITQNVNSRLLDYQVNDSVRIPFRQDMSAAMREFSIDKQIDSIFVDFPFGLRLWKHFVERDSRMNHSRQVVYARLNRQKRVELAVNNRFYNSSLPQPIDNQWRGNLVSVNDTAISWRVIPRSSNGLTAYRLPSEWMVDGRERTIVSAENVNIKTSSTYFTMKRGITNTAVIDNSTHLKDLQDTDLQSVMQHRKYFARNVMVNGNRMFFYPQGSSLFWVRNLSGELFTQKNQIAEDKRPSDFNSDIIITLSDSLSRGIYHELERLGNVTQSSVMVANGNGDVLAMVSHDREYKIDPNDRRGIARLTDSLEMYGLRGSEIERRIFGNLNLLHLKYGPGSTQKPLVWTAVASQLNYNWATLNIEGYGGSGRIEGDGGSHFIIHEFNTESFLRNHPFKPLLSDECNGNILSLHDYMAYSSNVYNALMIYIGSFPYGVLTSAGFNEVATTHNEQTLFANITSHEFHNTATFRHRFPILRQGNNIFSLNQTIQSSDQPSSLFESSMHEMFFRNDTVDEFRQNMPYDYYVSPLSSSLNANWDKRNNGYSYIEKSFFRSRQGTSKQLLLENAIRSTAIGAQQVWEVTPWKMAESFGRMASLNRSFYLSVLKRRPPSYRLFEGVANNDGYSDARPVQMKGMSDVLTINGNGNLGTAWRTGGHLGMRHAPEMQSNQLDGYYLYAKTGTIGEDNKEQHRLGVIIADHDLAQTDVDDLEDVKFFVIYFTVSTTAKWNLYADVITLIMNSPEFISYMKS